MPVCAGRESGADYGSRENDKNAVVLYEFRVLLHLLGISRRVDDTDIGLHCINGALRTCSRLVEATTATAVVTCRDHSVNFVK